ncbi:MAG: leucyl aminopeptidase [Verrucomicrobiae bacterium]|nr:leucyl aminopeptidase [Verrucomicrobiae bacterium]
MMTPPSFSLIIRGELPSKAKMDALLVAVPPRAQGASPWAFLPAALARECERVAPAAEFRGKEGDLVVAPALEARGARWLAVAGLGARVDALPRGRALGRALRTLAKRHCRRIGIAAPPGLLSPALVAAAAEEATYDFTEYRPRDAETLAAPSSEILLFDPSARPREAAAANAVAAAVRAARALANQPPNVLNPATLAAEARRLAARRRLRCEIWDERRLRREGFGALLAVGGGSANPPRFIRLDYRGGRRGAPPAVIVGKAITFDTGGLSLKPGERMDEMKFDKCGGIAALGVMDAVAALRLPLNVTALIAAAENMPSATAYRPGDLVKTLSGRYIEVLNTDAEGRMVLADAVTYAQRLKPRAIVDLATLTGACLICLAHEAAALLGNDDRLAVQLLDSAERTGQRLWRLPMWPEFKEMMKSEIAYVKNIAGREGATITGACFIGAFVEEDVPWAHLDIAGMAWTSKEEPHRPKGATAFGVRLLTDWLRGLASS